MYENTVVRKKRVDPDSIPYIPTIQKVSPDSEFLALANEFPGGSGVVNDEADIKDFISE